MEEEILRLKKMLEDAGIPFEYDDDVFGEGDNLQARQIVVFVDDEGNNVDAIYNTASYGYTEGLLEIMGGLTEKEGSEDSVLGYLTAEEVFERFKYCYENHTTVYKDDESQKEKVKHYYISFYANLKHILSLMKEDGCIVHDTFGIEVKLLTNRSVPLMIFSVDGCTYYIHYVADKFVKTFLEGNHDAKHIGRIEYVIEEIQSNRYHVATVNNANALAKTSKNKHYYYFTFRDADVWNITNINMLSNRLAIKNNFNVAVVADFHDRYLCFQYKDTFYWINYIIKSEVDNINKKSIYAYVPLTTIDELFKYIEYHHKDQEATSKSFDILENI